MSYSFDWLRVETWKLNWNYLKQQMMYHSHNCIFSEPFKPNLKQVKSTLINYSYLTTMENTMMGLPFLWYIETLQIFRKINTAGFLRNCSRSKRARREDERNSVLPESFTWRTPDLPKITPDFPPDQKNPQNRG